MSRKFGFTKRGIEALPAHDPNSISRESEYSDAECIGLHLRIGKNGRRFFQHRYRFLGRKKCLSVGEFPAISVQEARQIVCSHKALMARGKDPSEEKSKLRADMTFAEFAEKHYMPHAKQHKMTWDDDAQKIAKRLNPALGSLRLSSISIRDVTLLHSAEMQRTTASTANHLLSTLRRMLNLACKWGLLEKNPAAGQEKFREAPPRQRYLSREEVRRFLGVLDEEPDRLSVSALRLLLYTGCRRDEILSLQWQFLHRDEARFFLPRTKNGRSRTVFLNERALAVVDDLIAKRDLSPRTSGSLYLFPSRGKARKPYLYDLRKPFERACRAAGIENFRPHDLRHTFASLAVSAGVPLFAVQHLLGHQDISMTQRYSHLAADDLRRASADVATLMDQVTAI